MRLTFRISLLVMATAGLAPTASAQVSQRSVVNKGLQLLMDWSSKSDAAKRNSDIEMVNCLVTPIQQMQSSVSSASATTDASALQRIDDALTKANDDASKCKGKAQYDTGKTKVTTEIDKATADRVQAIVGDTIIFPNGATIAFGPNATNPNSTTNITIMPPMPASTTNH